MLRDISPEYKELDILNEIRKNSEKNQIGAAITAAVGQTMWYAVDYYILPSNKFFYLIWHLMVMILPLTAVLFRKRLGLDGSICHFIAVIGMASIAPYTANLCDAENLFIFVTGCSIVFIGSGVLGIWSFWWSLYFLLVFLGALLLGNLLIGKHDPFTFFFYLFGPVALSGSIGLIILSSRIKILMREFVMSKILEKSKDDLAKNKEKIKSELDFLIYSISHDLRSPILSVKGLLMLIRDYEKLNPSNKDMLDMAESSIDRLDRTIYDMLDYADNAGFSSAKEKFNIGALVKEIFEDLRFMSKNEVDFQIEIEGSDMVFSDKKRIKTIIKNLASNAVKYSRKDIKDPFVRFSMQHTADGIEFQLTDNGSGIPKEQQDKIFEMFYRYATDISGSGLGLFIVKEVLSKLGGTISLDSEPAKGSVFMVSLPHIEKSNYQSELMAVN